MNGGGGFSTRKYALGAGPAAGLAGISANASALKPRALSEFILGRSTRPIELPRDAIRARLKDPFAQLVFVQGNFPMTLRETLASLDSAGIGIRFPERDSFVVSDGGQIPWAETTRTIDRQMRFAVTFGAPNEPRAVMISTGADFDSEEIFLQVVGWDPDAGAFQFYDRREGAWIWAGSSWDALSSDARGRGPFDSHVNGALNMKELKLPWINWHSEAATIDASISAVDSIRSETLWKNKSGGETFEMKVARPGIRQWTSSRLETCTQDGRLTRVPEFFRQVLGTLAVNLRTSTVEMSRIGPDVNVPIPLTFFINSDVLVDILELEPGIQSLPFVNGGIYLKALRHFDVALTDGNIRVAGDTHFAFMYPEPAFEDVLIVEQLVGLGAISIKMAAALLMVDFCNPVFSSRRSALLSYCPVETKLAKGANAGAHFDQTFVDAVRSSTQAVDPTSAQAEFLANWDQAADEWKPNFQNRIAAFLAKATDLLKAEASFFSVFELAASRRREFTRSPLSEFSLTTPITNIPPNSPTLEFTPQGLIRSKKEEL